MQLLMYWWCDFLLKIRTFDFDVIFVRHFIFLDSVYIYFHGKISSTPTSKFDPHDPHNQIFCLSGKSQKTNKIWQAYLLFYNSKGQKWNSLSFWWYELQSFNSASAKSHQNSSKLSDTKPMCLVRNAKKPTKCCSRTCTTNIGLMAV